MLAHRHLVSLAVVLTVTPFTELSGREDSIPPADRAYIASQRDVLYISDYQRGDARDHLLSIEPLLAARDTGGVAKCYVRFYAHMYDGYVAALFNREVRRKPSRIYPPYDEWRFSIKRRLEMRKQAEEQVVALIGEPCSEKSFIAYRDFLRIAQAIRRDSSIPTPFPPQTSLPASPETMVRFMTQNVGEIFLRRAPFRDEVIAQNRTWLGENNLQVEKIKDGLKRFQATIKAQGERFLELIQAGELPMKDFAFFTASAPPELFVESTHADIISTKLIRLGARSVKITADVADYGAREDEKSNSFVDLREPKGVKSGDAKLYRVLLTNQGLMLADFGDLKHFKRQKPVAAWDKETDAFKAIGAETFSALSTKVLTGAEVRDFASSSE
jgi:hypothetical protein